MKRSKFSLSHYKLLTCDMGKLIPIGCFEVLPGDTVQQATSALIRCSPLLAPVMHPVEVKIHHWYVPNRIIWNEWEDFITGGPDGMSLPIPPYFDLGAGVSVQQGDLLDYFGVPTGVPITGDNRISALPVRAYNKIYNEWYRDQDLNTELPITMNSGQDGGTLVTLANCAWEKDYFTTARPWTQKGPEVTLPLGVSAPVLPTDVHHTGPYATALGFRNTDGTLPTSAKGLSIDPAGNVVYSDVAGGANPKTVFPTNLHADLTNATAATINDLREAFALQRYEEARARYGSRYTEYLRYLGVRSSDARLQRPEYLGGGKQTIQFSEVLQTAPGADVGEPGVASMYGHGIGAMRSNRYRRFFEEHGFVISLMSVKPRTMYIDGLHKMWYRSTKEEYFQKELQHIGQQAIRNKEVYMGNPLPNETFGYQDRYDEYRRMESYVSGEFRSTMNHWHYAREFASPPVLNGEFVSANPTKRTNADQSSHCLYVMANHSIQARRLVAKSGNSFIF